MVLAWLASAERWYLPRAMERLPLLPGFLFAHRSEESCSLLPATASNRGDIGPKNPAVELFKISLHRDKSCGFCLMIQDTNRIGRDVRRFDRQKAWWRKEGCWEFYLLKCVLSFSLPQLLGFVVGRQRCLTGDRLLFKDHNES